MIIFVILALINIITWYPVLSFWFFQSWEATWLLGNCGQHVNPICLMQGHALLYFIDYKIFGWNPWGWYLTTLLLHILAVYLSYHLIKKISKEKLISFLVALIFGVNITYYDVLTWGSFNGLYALMMVFFLSSTILYLNFFENRKRKLLWYIAISLLLLVGLFVRESSLILPAFLVLGYLYKRGFTVSKKDFIFMFKSISPLLIVIAGYFLIRKIYGGPTYDYIDETVQYRVKLISQGLYLEYGRRSLLLIGVLTAPQAIPFQLLNWARDTIAEHFHPKFINLYFFPFTGYVYLALQVLVILKNWKNTKMRNLLLFGLLWSLIPTIAASLPISFTDEVFQRPFNLNTPPRWRYFSFFGTTVFWISAFWAFYHYCVGNFKKQLHYIEYAFAFAVLLVVGGNMIALHVIENDVYKTSYKPEKEFYTTFRKDFPDLPKNYLFYVFPGSGSLKDYLSEWYHIRNVYYPNLTEERETSWEESHMAMLFDRYKSEDATLNNTFFLSYDDNGLIDKTKEARDIISHMQQYAYPINQQVSSTQSAYFDSNSPHAISINLQQRLHVEIPYDIKISLSSILNDDSTTSTSNLKTYVNDRLDFLQHASVKVCGTAPLGQKPAYHLSPNNLIDGNIGQRSFWVADCRPGWVMVDLGEIKNISGIAFHTNVGPQMPSSYTIEASEDGKRWIVVKKVNDNTLSQRIDLFEQNVQARYVKFTVAQTSEGAMLSLDELEAIGAEARDVVSPYGNDFEKLLSDSYAQGGLFLRYSWSTDPNNFTPEDLVKNNTYFTALTTDNQEHTYTIQPNEGEFFSNTGQFLSRYITSINLDFVGRPATITVNELDITPRFTFRGGSIE